MSATSAIPLSTNRSNFAFLPGKLEVKSDELLPFSGLLLLSQIFWYSIGLSLIYDITERMWHWPHLLVIGSYGGMLVASAWLSHRAVKIFSIVTLLALFVIALFAIWPSTELGFMHELVTILASRRIDYASWLFVMGCSFLGRLSVVWHVKDKQLEFGAWIALASFLIGCAIAMLPQVIAMYATGANLEAIISSQGLTLIWLAYWAMPTRCNPKANEGYVNRTLIKYLKLPKNTIILMMGAFSYVFYDWACQYLAIWLQIIWFFAPVAIYFYIQKSKIAHSS